MSEYALKVGDEGAERLNSLNDVFGPYSQSYLTDIGLHEGMQVLELGCGTGSMTTWIAKQVGSSGNVIAIDASNEQLEHARKNAAHEKLDNIKFIHCRADEVDIDAGSIDLIYSRFLMMHLPDPVSVLKKMCALLKENGILACEEPTASSLLTYPRVDVIQKLNEIFITLGAKRGMDYNIGDKLPVILTDLNLRLIKPRFIQPIISIGTAKKFIGLGVKETLMTIINENIISQQEADILINALQNAHDNKSAYYAFPRQAQIAGMKRSSKLQTKIEK